MKSAVILVKLNLFKDFDGLGLLKIDGSFDPMIKLCFNDHFT